MKGKLRASPPKLLFLATLMAFSMGAEAHDVGFGIGVSYIFGEGPAIGIKAFSDNQENRGVGAIGVDYVFSNQSIRPNIGVAYQGDGYFGDANIGYSFSEQKVDFGTGLGWSNADDHHKKSTPPPPAPAPLT
ncbi:hypothetical protein HX890_06670 [Pseudomonas gingeri]|uniref:hypothetical protein n=1 Tax=Pseudomonas gingeri TaxID=117681 RepID=UPI0015A08162|nr:hypothetical protein [Pseudomonas gingeri]NWD73803.1 hypothetical protein [Pseudomonas gingeri]